MATAKQKAASKRNLVKARAAKRRHGSVDPATAHGRSPSTSTGAP